mmetsp:Transcript_13700/g.31856  ORF Transcript_13700/g.31856 Transcript_13700/m.31856 type:complete len:449 (+) Transcript_13700:293-1639(+)|eukprot:CAMPEP_0116830502 /NCGR_PEP_ID=MMETSP0418-20121206/4796_1 /TAXON_ID=1158023 /ORGANISM="Astrosyne radiata, Strain 13vi08-1A" /LENGTH=448 /DNA_ID=CAMNT_0004459607 /DNA_START=281 /DNA_END=1627 /DNA_ORIENTATION=-
MKIADRYYQFDKNYMDGGGEFNKKTANPPMDGFAIGMYETNYGNLPLNWPKYDALVPYYTEQAAETGKVPPSRPFMDNFNLDESCDLRVAMCCFTDAVNSKAFVPNAKVCHHDLHPSQRSAHVSHGDAYFVGGGTDAHCVGFTWDSQTPSDPFKANMLYEISYKYWYDNGYIRNVPGAPMCGCIEKMPTVTTSKCIELDPSNTQVTYQVTDDGAGGVTVSILSSNVAVRDCGISLEEYHDRSSGATPEEKAAVTEKILGDTCDASTMRFFNSNYLVPQVTDQYDLKPADRSWTQVAGQGTEFLPLANYDNMVEREEQFLRLLMASSTKIVYRKCGDCLPGFQDIYYKRINTANYPSPEFLDLFLNHWAEVEFNEFDVDFELYSDYTAAVNRDQSQKWQYHDYTDERIGFPFESGPTGMSECQWNSYNPEFQVCGGYYAPVTTAFYVDS